MLAFASSLLHFVLTTLLPLLGLALTAALVLYGMYLRWLDVPHKWMLTRRALHILCGVALALDALLLLQLYLPLSARQARDDSAAVRASRERFVLPRDFQYGELRIPQGSLINRNDPFDKGEPNRPLALHGLAAVRFAQPMEVAGVWGSALQTVPARVELAQDQKLGPVFRYDSATEAWVPHKLMPAVACRKGQIAVFQVPHIPYDVQAEVGKPAPDGVAARFRPSEWLFRGCEAGPPVSVAPAAPPPTAD